MGQIPLGVGAFARPYARLPEIRMENRFFESNPLGAEQTALLSRPGSRLLLEEGDGPIRSLYAQPGVFDEDLFFVSGDELYRYDGETATLITGTVSLNTMYPIMTSVSIPDFQALFITDGETLQHYLGVSRATGTLTASGAIADNETVRIGDTYYEFTNASVNAGTPAGSAAFPWLVALGSDDEESLANLAAAIDDSGTSEEVGVIYSVLLTPHPTVRTRELTATTFVARAIEPGTAGNSITTTETGANLAWGAGALSGGGSNALVLSDVPTDVSIVDLATLKQFVIGVRGGSHEFYYIPPGEVDIHPLNFYSAESEPDNILHCMSVGDQVWFFGESSTEPWYVTGNPDDPFAPSQGRVFSQGVIQNTVARHQDQIVVIGQDKVAYHIGAGPQRISHHGIEETIRRWQESLS